MSEIYGLSIEKLSELAKKVREGRNLLGLSREELSQMLGITIGKIKYLESFAMIEKIPQPKERIVK